MDKTQSFLRHSEARTMVDVRAGAGTPTAVRRTRGRDGLMNKLFARRSTRDNGLASDESDPEPILDRVTIGPCPYIRPIGHNLVARCETFPRYPASARPSTSLSRARRFGEVVAASRDASLRIPHSPDSQNFSDGLHSQRSSIGHRLDHRITEVCDAIAADAALGRQNVRDWAAYLRSYSEGQFNMMSPPIPPPKNPDFMFLPAIYPSNEGPRLAAVKKCDLNWDDWVAERARDICSEVMEKFGVLKCAISVFDKDSEIFKAERGYDRQVIPRWESLAGHVLMSNDVLTILDTERDWRFAGNPQVRGHPNIRFFAGAPMLAPNGEVLGVVSVFDCKPRGHFSVFQRRELCDFATMAMSDLAGFRGNNPDSGRETPILQRRDLNEGTAVFEGGYSPTCRKIRNRHNEDDEKLVPPALNLRKPSKESNNKAAVGAVGSYKQNRANRRALQRQQTPPTSDDSEDDLSLHWQPSQERLLSARAGESGPCAVPKGELTPETPTLTHFPSPAFVGDDSESQEEFGRSITPTPALQMLGITTESGIGEEEVVVHNAGDAASLFSTTNSPKPVLRFNSATGIFSESTKPPVNALDIMSQEHAPKTKANNNRMSTYSICSLESDLYETELLNANPKAEGDFAVELWARRLGYDVMYAVQMSPANDFMTEEELLAPGGIQMRLLANFGISDDMEFDNLFHLQALRCSTGAITWSYDDSPVGEFGSGLLMAMADDGLSPKHRSHGIVFGAFRKVPETGNFSTSFTDSDIRELQDASLLLKHILRKRLPTQSPERSKTAPASPGQPFPADEAWEIGKFSLDAGMRRIQDYSSFRFGSRPTSGS